MGKSKINRRNFLKTGSILTGAAGSMFPDPGGYVALNENQDSRTGSNKTKDQGELLYNGIVLPPEWPPRNMKPDDYDPMPVPYLTSPPKVIPIDVGRQLFVDDFLIEKTDLKRTFHQPDKYINNPILRPETAEEMNQGYCPMAAPFSDGCFYDPKDKLFKLWYMAGWFGDKTAQAISKDGIHWERPKYTALQDNNLVVTTEGFCRDGASVWLDHEAAEETERFKLYMYLREGKLGHILKEYGGFIWTSPDGLKWNRRGKIGPTGDNSTFYYNPFRKKWVFTVRTSGRPAPPWSIDPWKGQSKGRARSYWENNDFLSAIGGWKDYDPVFWLGADKLDHKRTNYEIGQEPQLYKIDAVGYESLMIGLLQLHYGPTNRECAKGGFPKLTELQLSFSRDGFHWDRSNRNTFIGATLKKNSWERAYVHSVGGVCNIAEDKLYFYYTAFQGDESKKQIEDHHLDYWSGMYANASTGLAILRRDGFASMNAGKTEGFILTRILMFSGKYFFVNADCTKGMIYIEICEADGTPIPGFTGKDCIPIRGDHTKQMMVWKGGNHLETFVNKPIRFKFYLTKAKLFSFWVSKDQQGTSGGATAAGGPGLTGNWGA